jgi:hypothetical protein
MEAIELTLQPPTNSVVPRPIQPAHIGYAQVQQREELENGAKVTSNSSELKILLVEGMPL